MSFAENLSEMSLACAEVNLKKCLLSIIDKYIRFHPPHAQATFPTNVLVYTICIKVENSWVGADATVHLLLVARLDLNTSCSEISHEQEGRRAAAGRVAPVRRLARHRSAAVREDEPGASIETEVSCRNQGHRRAVHAGRHGKRALQVPWRKNSQG